MKIIIITIIDKAESIMYNTDIHKKQQNTEKFSRNLLTK